MEQEKFYSKDTSMKITSKENFTPTVFDVTKKSIKDFMNQRINKTFNYTELQDAIIKEGGIMRLTYGYPVNDLIKTMVNTGALTQLDTDGNYNVNHFSTESFH